MKDVVNSGTKVDDKEIVYLTEMLMRQLLKLDGIEAEGEGKVQRKMEVSGCSSLKCPTGFGCPCDTLFGCCKSDIAYCVHILSKLFTFF